MYKQNLVLFIFLSTLALSSLGQSHWESIVVESDQFKYSVPQVEPAIDWVQLDFDDTSWSEGVGGFGYADGDDNTIVEATTSVYLRKKITMPSTATVMSLFLDIDYDDAFVAYLNGTEIARSTNLPAGTPGLSASITRDHEAVLYSGGVPERFIINPTSIIDGENMLAVHILNYSQISSDLSARVFLNAEISGNDVLFKSLPSWFKMPVQFSYSNLPIITINTGGTGIPDEPKLTAQMQVINNVSGVNFFNDTVYEYDGYIGIEIRGNTAKMFPKKSYTVETRLEDGSNNNVELLGMPSENDWVLHGPYSDKSMMRNALAYSIGNGMNHWCPRTHFVELLINEEYRGVYLMVEKMKIDKNRLDIATLKPEDISGDQLTGGYLISIDRDQEGSWNSPFWGRTGSVDVPFSYVDPSYKDLAVEQRNYIRDYITEFEYALHGDDFMDPELGYRAYIDVVSFIDYFIITELSRDLDGYRVSVFFHKDKDSKGGKLTMSPFWDYNLCFGNANFMQAGDPVGWAADGIGAADAYEIPFWWDRFIEDPYFVTVLKHRWEKLRKDVISKNTIDGFIDSCQLVLKEPQERNFEKFNILNTYVWPNNYVGGTYDNEVSYLKNWISDRIDWLDSEMDAIDPAFPNSLEASRLRDMTVRVYPNPFKEKFKLEFKLIADSRVDVIIRNILGETVCTRTQQSFSGGNVFEFTKDELGTGGKLYFYTILVDLRPFKSGKVLRW